MVYGRSSFDVLNRRTIVVLPTATVSSLFSTHEKLCTKPYASFSRQNFCNTNAAMSLAITQSYLEDIAVKRGE